MLRPATNGRSSTAIAAELVVSVNTVKVHGKKSSCNLHVTNHLAAASTARDLRLRERQSPTRTTHRDDTGEQCSSLQ